MTNFVNTDQRFIVDHPKTPGHGVNIEPAIGLDVTQIIYT